ncbi:MAG: type II toxin-antitoxin system HicB family antitoxin [Pseudomonadota bacterium]
MLFKIILKPDSEDGGYNVSCPALPGCHSQGETEDEAIDNIKDAIVGCLEALNQRAIIHNESERLIEVAVS